MCLCVFNKLRTGGGHHRYPCCDPPPLSLALDFVRSPDVGRLPPDAWCLTPSSTTTAFGWEGVCVHKAVLESCGGDAGTQEIHQGQLRKR